jgi:ComF family protein
LGPSIHGVFNLIFPRKCVHCDREIDNKKSLVCFGCEAQINWSKPFKNKLKNQVLQGVYMPNVQGAYSLFSFSKEGVEQSLIHSLKYQGSQKTGRNLGKSLGQTFLELNGEHTIDCLVPVPIFHRKKFIRGYNQTRSIAQGLASELNIPVQNNLLRKKKSTKSQTKLSRNQRRLNVENSFVASRAFKELSEVGIVDDVVTTGATLLELCTEIVKVNESIKITIFTLGVARLE